MATVTQLAPSPTSSTFKFALWIVLGLTTLFVFITSEVFLVADYPMYHRYRLQVIADRDLLIPHVLFGTIALLSGPIPLSLSLLARSLALPSPLAGPACREPPCRRPHGLFAQLPHLSPRATAKSHSIASGWRAPTPSRSPLYRAACLIYGPVTGAILATCSLPWA